MRCEASGALVPKDKAIKRFIVRNLVDASAVRDLSEASAVESEYKHSVGVSSITKQYTALPVRSLRRLEGSLHLTTSMFDKQGKYREHSIQLQSTTVVRLEIVYVSSRSCCLFTLEWAVRSLGMVLLADKELQPVNTSNTVSWSSWEQL